MSAAARALNSVSSESFSACLRRRVSINNCMMASSSSNSNHHQQSKILDQSNSSPCSETLSLLEDDPCWGSPDRCAMSDLFELANVRKSSHILYESKNFLAFNKPPDVRMDREYKCTVHKLLSFWYPPPSLQQEVLEKMEQSEDPNSVEDNAMKDSIRLKLLQSKYHLHSDHVDNELRPCHQLDYATSGVLLVARSRLAANRARTAFEVRSTRKSYLALLQGDLSPMLQAKLPVHPSLEHVKDRWNQMEKDYRKIQQKNLIKKNKNTFMGYQPASALFQQWQQQQRRKEKEAQYSAQINVEESNPNKKRKSNHKTHSKHPKITSEEWDLVWNELHTDDDNGAFAVTSQMNWKQVKAMKQSYRFERAADVYNKILLKYRKEEPHDEGDSTMDNVSASTCEPLPMLFRVSSSNDTNSYQEVDSIFICASIADIPGQFSVSLDAKEDTMLPEIPRKYPNLFSSWPTNDTATATKAPNFKPSLTECRILEKFEDRSDFTSLSRTVTKVLLTPWSGRRHQLRIHTAVLGHPIVGDFTYNPQSHDERDKQKIRMCLHAHKLRIDLGENETSSEEGSRILEFEAPDPFV